MPKLSEKLILQKTRLESLGEVRNLNLWGQDLDDVSILQQMPATEVLSLSVNKISTLRDFMYCRNLQELYLRRNDIQNLADLHYLVSLPNLTVLWLSDNPCADTPHYREQVIKALPGLTKLDNEEVRAEERAHVASMNLPPLPRPSAQQKQEEQPMSRARSVPAQGNAGRSGEGEHQAPERSASSEQVVGGRRPVANAAAHSSGSPQRASPARRRPPTAQPSKSDAVLYAVLKLLDVLDDNDLLVVRREIDARTGAA